LLSKGKAEAFISPSYFSAHWGCQGLDLGNPFVLEAGMAAHLSFDRRKLLVGTALLTGSAFAPRWAQAAAFDPFAQR
jgi:hypothetical protein